MRRDRESGLYALRMVCGPVDERECPGVGGLAAMLRSIQSARAAKCDGVIRDDG